MNIVSPGDGQQMLIDATKLISHRIKLGAVSSKDVTAEYLDKLLQGTYVHVIRVVYEK